jgi:hypothetical protein
MRPSRLVLILFLALACAGSAWAQGNPTGAVSGQVLDPDGLVLPGVTVTAAAPTLQGTRSAVTTSNGDYIIPLLPPGDYTLTFELSGFATLKQTVRVEIGATIPVKVKMALAKVTEVITVTAVSTEIAQTATIATTVKSDIVENIPLGRTLVAATLLSPGTSDNGPAGNIMISGALSYENLNLINGVVVNENLRNQARLLFIEDAIQETKVSTGSISAEYGRFQGGVVNMLTKSGGNNFGGSFRTTFTNDSWKALTPYVGDANLDKTVPAYELTFGGPVLKDRLWFFGAGRFEKNSFNSTMPYTGYNYTRMEDEKRYEGKGTFALNKNNTTKVSYIKRTIATTNNTYSTVMDARSLYNNSTADTLLSLNHGLVLNSRFFVEAQYSNRKMQTHNTGAQYTDLVKGTPIWDRSRGQARFNSPTFCAVCGTGWVEDRNNWNGLVKANYFLSTSKLGSHNIVGGVDVYKETRKNNNYQSGSTYRVQATSTIIDGQTIYPVLKTGTTTYVEWLPIFELSVGSDIRTYSGFLNDTWAVNRKLTVNLGLRYDKNNVKDQGAKLVANAGEFSPRAGASWDVKGDGVWIANTGFAHYVAGFTTAVADVSSAAGRQASFSYYYAGPSVNTAATGPYLTADQALPILFDWFFANGGTSRTTRTTPTVPGVSTAVNPSVRASNANEYTVGLSRRLGSKGAVRVDFLYRTYADYYGNFVNPSTGKVYDPRTNKTFDLTIVGNTNDVERNYKGLSTQFSYRVFRGLQVSANWMLSYARGSLEGEDETNGPTRASANEFPEYRQASWNYPVGYTNGDQRHKIRVWGTYRLPVPSILGNLDLGLMQRFDSGLGYDHSMSINTQPYVTNPGYLSPPSSVTYYISGRGEFQRDNIWRTDLSLSWTHKLPQLKRGQLFFRAVMTNVFNHTRIDGFNTTILGKSTDSTLAAFNPFTETPVYGVNWKYGPSYGQPTGPGSYQAPREFSFSGGIRF